MNVKKVTKYLYGDSDELSELWDYEAPQQDVFHYALYEVTIELEVDLDTGRSRIATVNGVELASKGEFS